MEKMNQIEFKVYGRRALFSDPITRAGGEKCSYQIPTYQALKGITESIYWKPTLVWYIDKVRIMKPIRTESQGVRPIEYTTDKNTLSLYTYLRDVEYHVQAHFEWNENRPELVHDRNENKHFFMAKRMLERGGRRDIFLGTRECQGYAEPCAFMEGEGAYDDLDELSYGPMVHGMTYPDEAKNKEACLTVRFWRPVMKHGIVTFIRPEECRMIRNVQEMKMKTFGTHNFSTVDELYELFGKDEVI